MTDTRGERRGLGRGLNALLADIGVSTDQAMAPTGTNPAEIAIERLQPNPSQPRQEFDEAALDDLAASISAKGILQPLLVRPDGDGYMIIAGERRWRAAQRAGLTAVPALIRDYSDAEVLEVAIIENIQRADLNPLDEAAGYQQLIDRFGHTTDGIANALGKSRSHIANLLRLLALPPRVADLLRSGQLTQGHARTLLGVANAEELAERIIAQGLSVRDAEKLSREVKTGQSEARDYGARKQPDDPDRLALEQDLTAGLGMKVRISSRPDGESGTVTLHYCSLADLDRLCQILSAGMD